MSSNHQRLNREEQSAIYNERYYSESYGEVPLERSAHWTNFFSIVADQCIRSLRPGSVLDAGCAKGFLVEAFWDRGVPCYGIDVSEYAISQVRADIRPYCYVVSLDEPIPGRYDLVTCIEVLEHIPAEFCERVIANLCSVTDTILFSSSPDDFDQLTHINLRPTVAWLKSFADVDFWPDVRFDASFLAPWAILFRRGRPEIEDLHAAYSEVLRFKQAFLKREGEIQRSTRDLVQLKAHFDRSQRFFANELAARSAEHADLVYSIREERMRLEQAGRNLISYAQELARNPGTRFGYSGYRVLQNVYRRLTGKPTVNVPPREIANILKPLRSGSDRAADSVELPELQPLFYEWQPSEPIKAKVLEPSYERWIKENEPADEELQRQRVQSRTWRRPLLISVVVPVWKVELSFLQSCVESVLNQTYSHWELCIAYAPDANHDTLEFLRTVARSDRRIRPRELDENGGISRNTNAAVENANGAFIAFLDHDDRLAPNALFEMATAAQHYTNTDFLYSDFDYLDSESGLRRDPLFKPDWSPEILLSANYLTHLTVISADLLKRVGPFDPATDGAQDWDLFFRATEAARRIVHVPKVLYHWRMHPASTAQNDAAKDVSGPQLIAIQRQLDRAGINAIARQREDGLLHVSFREMPSDLVSIIIPTKDRADLLSRTVHSLLERTACPNYELLILDNGSKEPETTELLAAIASDQRVRVLPHPESFNYSAINNHGAREAAGSLLLFLNNDVEIVDPDWLTELVCWAKQPSIGAVGGRLKFEDGTIQHAGVVVGLTGFAGHPFAGMPALSYGMYGSTGWYRNYLAVTGACMMMRRSVFEEIGGFDEKFIVCGSDVEICLRAVAHGYRNLYNPFAELIHYEKQTRGSDIPPCDFAESLKHYRLWIERGDPFWNPNLSLWNNQPFFRFNEEADTLRYAERLVAALTAAQPSAMPLSDEHHLVQWFDCSDQQFEELRHHGEHVIGFRNVRHVIWFIPNFENAFYGGIYTILQFAHNWHNEFGVTSSFAVCGHARASIADAIRQVYPEFSDENLHILESVAAGTGLPLADVSICTLWTTAYYALHHKPVSRRFYFIQDFEAAFYRAGSISALVDSTYRMGLYGIANTVSLKRTYEAEYGGKAIAFTPRINKTVFLPDKLPERADSDTWKVFCYGRPSHGRNAFELVAAAMKEVKKRLTDRVHIVSAGGDWNPHDHGLQDIIENLGVLSYEDTARLYRTCDVGAVMMLTRHPSYIPLELMASGCVTVTNVSAWTSWLLKHRENCLLTFPTVTAVADTVELALTDKPLRDRIRSEAFAEVQSQQQDWSVETSRVYEFLCDPETVWRRPDANGNVNQLELAYANRQRE